MKHKVTGEVVEPITLEDAKIHLRTILGDTTEDEAILKPIITAAREFAENVTGCAFAQQELTAYPDGWETWQLPKPPVRSVERVTYRDENGVTRELPKESYSVDAVDGKVYVTEAPKERLGMGNPIEVTYTAGYEKVPMTVRQAMLLLIGHWYNNREAVAVGSMASVEVGLTTKALLNQHKVWWF